MHIIVDNKEKVSWPLVLKSEISIVGFKVAGPENGLVAVYRPDEQSIILYDLSGAVQRTITNTSGVTFLRMIPGGYTLYCTSLAMGCQLHVISPAGNDIWSTLVRGGIMSVSPDGEYIAVYEGNYTVSVRETKSGQEKLSLHYVDPRFISVSSDAKYILVAGERSFTLYNSKGEEVLSGATLDPMRIALISYDGSHILLADSSGRLYYYDNPEAARLRQLVGVLVMATIFSLGLLAILRFLRGEEKPKEQPEEEELYP
jgi:WD40 repeat protein